MQNNMKAQKVMYYGFLIMEIIASIYALAFMTDFAVLFGLRTEANAPIAEFHNVLMQEFNQAIFIFAIIGILTFVCSKILTVNKTIVDKIALVIMGVLLLAIAAFSVYALVQLQSLQTVYLGLDFQYLANEGGAEYFVKTRTFRIGTAVYVAQALFCLGYVGVIASNHVTYLKRYGRAAA